MKSVTITDEIGDNITEFMVGNNWGYLLNITK